MNCNRCQEFLHLYRPGELSDRQTQQLNRHLDRCPVCAKLRDRIRQTDLILTAAKRSVPRPDNPTLLTNRIMAGIQTVSRGFPSRVSKMFGIRHRQINSSRLTFGLAAAIFLIVAAFFGQEAMILSRLSRLEGRMADVSQIGERNNSSIPIRFPSVEKKLGEIEGMNLNRSVSRDDWVMVKKADLDYLIRSLRDSHAVQGGLLKIIKGYDPEIRTLDPDLSRESERMRGILARNPRMVKRLQHIFKTGGQI